MTTKERRKKSPEKSRFKRYSWHKREEGRMSGLRECNLHHYNPTSRISPEALKMHSFRLCEQSGMSEKILKRQLFAVKIVPIRIHNAWHVLFGNLLSWEARDVIRIWTPGNLKEMPLLPQKHIDAWNTVFGDGASAIGAIKIVTKEWWPKYPPPDASFWHDKLSALVLAIFKEPAKSLNAYIFRKEDFDD